MQPIRLFSKRAMAESGARAEMAEILKPFWKTTPVPLDQWESMYGIRSGEYEVVEDISEAQLAVLPLCWNYYLHNRKVDEASRFIALARGAGVPILTYVMGDEGVRVPDGFDDVWVIRASGVGRDRRLRQIAQPVFFSDPLVELGMGESELLEARSGKGNRSRSSLPSVGFCGQASVRKGKVALDLARTQVRNWSHGLGLRIEEPQPLYSTALLRARALDSLQKSSRLHCNFILRERYRAGAKSEEERRKTTREFFDNMLYSDYVLCVRGGGNFSKRFYETLAMGAIPLLVDTDCVLPLDDCIEWDDHMVRVPMDQLGELENLLLAFHSGPKQLDRRQVALRSRTLWKERLTFGGFHRYALASILKGKKPTRSEGE
jgi:hypothetical protein